MAAVALKGAKGKPRPKTALVHKPLTKGMCTVCGVYSELIKTYECYHSRICKPCLTGPGGISFIINSRAKGKKKPSCKTCKKPANPELDLIIEALQAPPAVGDSMYVKSSK